MRAHPTAVDELEQADNAKAAATLAPPEDAGTGYVGAAVELATEANGGPAIGRYRWVICSLLFFATTVNYMDRAVLAVLSPLLQQDFHWTHSQYGYITSAFSGAYAVGLLLAGNVIDRLGTRLGYPLFMALWGLASISHALVRSVFGFGVARIFLGFFEAGNFPAAIKTTAEWFPKKERSLAIGVFNSGSNIGAILAPLLVPLIAIHFGWRWAFCLTGVLELIWIACWFTIYRRPEEHPKLLPAERAYIRSDPVEEVNKVRWAKLLPLPQTWAFAIGKALTDPVWWFWLFWAAPYLHDKFGLDIKHVGLPLIIIYNMASVGSIGGGWIASQCIRAGFTLNVGRKLGLLICGLGVLPVVTAPLLHSEWAVVLLIGLAAASHQGFSANLFALSGDLFPRRVVGSVVGIGGLFGGIAGMIFPALVGLIYDRFGTYAPVFVYAAAAYLVSIVVIQVLSPRLEVAQVDDAPMSGFPVIAQ